MRPYIRDNLQHYYLPIGVLGLVHQVANIYIYTTLICGYCPLWPSRRVRSVGYGGILCGIVVIFIIGFDSASASHLQRWEFITSVVGNFCLFLSWLILATIAAHDHWAKLAKADTELQTDVDGTLQNAAVHEGQPPPPYSEDLEKGKTAADYKTQALDLEVSQIVDHEATTLPEYSVKPMSSKEPEAMGSSLTTMIVQEDVNDPLLAQTQTATQSKTEAEALGQAQKEPDTKPWYYFISNIPGAVLVLSGLLGQLARNLPTDWTHIDRIRNTIFVFSILIAATILGTLVRLFRLKREQAQSDKESNSGKGNYKYADCLLGGGIVLSFFIVSFDEWLLAALVNDITGANHILSDGGLPLVYMILTKLPALTT